VTSLPSSASGLISRLPLDLCKFCLALMALSLLEGMYSRNTSLKHARLLECRQHTMHTPMELLQTQANCSFYSFESVPHLVMYPIVCQKYPLPGVFLQARHQLKRVAGSTTRSFTPQNVKTWLAIWDIKNRVVDPAAILSYCLA